MLGIGPMELVVVLIVALIVFGPRRLPEIGSTLGRSVREFRRATSEITQELTQSMDEVRQPIEDIKRPIEEIRQLPASVLNTSSELSASSASSASSIEEELPVGNSRLCPKCSSPNPHFNKFCGQCGVELS